MSKIIDFVNKCHEARVTTRTRVMTLNDMGSAVTIRAERMEKPKSVEKLKVFPQMLFDRKHQEQLLGIFNLDTATFYQNEGGLFGFYMGDWHFQILPQNQGVAREDVLAESLANDLTQGSDAISFVLGFGDIRFKIGRVRGSKYNYALAKDVLVNGTLDDENHIAAYAKTMTDKLDEIGGFIWLADELGKRFNLAPSVGGGDGLYLYNEEMVVVVNIAEPNPTAPGTQ